MEKLRQQELDNIVKLHEEWLESDGKKGERAKIIDKNLRHLSLEHVDLTNAVFSRCDMSNMHISMVNFSRVKFNKVNLDNANIYKNKINAAELCDVTLNNTTFCMTDLSRSYLTEGTDLSKACLQGTTLHRAKLNKTYYKLTDCSNENTAVTYCIEDKLVSCGFCNGGKFCKLKEFKDWYYQHYYKDSDVDDILSHYQKLKAYYAMCIKILERIL